MSDRVVIRAKSNIPEANRGRTAAVSAARAEELAEKGLAVIVIGQAAKDEDSPPSGNASEDAWREYWLRHGYTEEELVDDDGNPLGRNALRSLSSKS